MNITKTKFLSILIVVALLSSMTVYGVKTGTYPGHKDPYVSTNLELTISDSMGTRDIPVGNVITAIGGNYCRGLLGSSGSGNTTAFNSTQWISASNDATGLINSTLTKLPNELNANGFTRALGTVVQWMNGTNPAYNVTATFTCTGGQAVQALGLQWSGGPATDSNLYACASFTQVTFAATDTLTVKWVVTYAIA